VRRDPLLRAIGTAPRHVLDSTAGFGNDAFSLALAGHTVIAAERCLPIALLLEDALDAARADPELAPAASRIELRVGDAAEVLETLRAHDREVDCIYLDPMFPPRRKSSALAKLPLQILQELVGPDTDSESLFAAAREMARDRVVVKRPDHADPLLANPTVSYAGKLTRHDVYYRQAGRD
jgi:16S rRNA (guanine1516-N2)-methyltransferase